MVKGVKELIEIILFYTLFSIFLLFTNYKIYIEFFAPLFFIISAIYFLKKKNKKVAKKMLILGILFDILTPPYPSLDYPFYLIFKMLFPTAPLTYYVFFLQLLSVIIIFLMFLRKKPFK